MPSADPSTTFITKTVVTPDSLLGDWQVLSAVSQTEAGILILRDKDTEIVISRSPHL